MEGTGIAAELPFPEMTWTLFVAMAGLVLARVVDPVTAQQVGGMITGI